VEDFIMAKQITLSKLSKRFRVALEESWQGELASNPDRRWLEIIPCKGFKKGPGQEGPFISLFSEDPPTLKLYTSRPRNAPRSTPTILPDGNTTTGINFLTASAGWPG
jgi:hypothetical protein